LSGAISHHRGAQNFFRRGRAREDLCDAGHPKALHAAADHLRLDLGRRGALEHELLQGIGKWHYFVECDAALVAGVVADLAAAADHDLCIADLLFAHPHLCERFGVLFAGLLAVVADLAREPLREHEVDRGGHEERLDAHVEEPRHRRRSVVGVQRR
jgi:hypothetical protein